MHASKYQVGALVDLQHCQRSRLLVPGVAKGPDSRQHRQPGQLQRAKNQHDSLAGFPRPDLVEAAIDGGLPQGMGVARLADLSAEWSRQHQMLGLLA